MRRQAERRADRTVAMIPEYGRQKLLGYAESFMDLAELFDNEEESDDVFIEDESRQEYLWKKKICESKGLMADHLKEMAFIMSDVAKETYRYRPMGERKYKKIARALKEAGITLKRVFVVENDDGHLEMGLMMKVQRMGRVIVADVADMLSVEMNIRIRPSKNEPLFMAKEWNTYHFLEEPAFYILTGIAKAVKETEKTSGDNYSFFEIERGRVAAVLSDGMGSGENACEESCKVIEMMERFMEAGFRKEMAVQIINGALSARDREQDMSTLDICELNLYTGSCDFIKVGAACTYIKRGNMVDRLSAENLPLGIFGQIEPEVVHRQLQDGDYVIMLSDGILDAVSQGAGEEFLTEIIGRISNTNPDEIANQILGYCIRQSRGHVRDDMTVLVIGIWK
ncbi:MAG: SpoIIE family protein phosphatase [Lachnospiraceae bacterium]|nr:SpoIIE family protein phosphatase [Lachnospiraceae bacterium]